MNTFQEKDKRKALLITLFIYAGLALLFLYFGLKYPDPPLEESGIEISMADYGFDDMGSGETEPSLSNATATEENVTKSETQTDSPQLEEVSTQEESEISIPKATEEVKKEESSEVKPVVQNTQAEKEPEPEINEKLKNVLGAWNESESATNEGSQPGTTGNEGIESGNNEGKGTFGGNGSSFELGGRSMISGPKMGEKPVEEGKVVLNIWVDRQGNILRISHNLQESTTTSQYLFNLAKKAALKAKFNPSPSAAPEQKGKMTFIFILQ